MADENPWEDLAKYKKAIEEEFETDPKSFATALEVLEAHSPEAALQIVVTMKHCPDARLRLKAAQYLLDNTVFAKPADEENLRKFLTGLTDVTEVSKGNES